MPAIFTQTSAPANKAAHTIVATRARGSKQRVRSAIGWLGSVRVRLTLWYLAILALVFLVFASALTVTAAQNEEFQEHAELLTASQELASTYSASDGLLHLNTLVTVSTPTAKRLLVHGKNVDRVYPLGPQDIAILLDAQTTVRQQIGPLTTQATLALQKPVLFPSTGQIATPEYFSTTLPVYLPNGNVTDIPYLIYLTRLTTQGQPVYLIVGRPNGFDQTVKRYIPEMTLIGLLTLIVAALGGYWLAARAMRPVRQITRAAQTISATDLSQRLVIRRRDELGELAATFDSMLDRLESAFARQRQFTADASHELRTPLAIIDLEASRALAAPRTQTEYERALATIQAENTYMARLVGNLLTLARADANQAITVSERIDLSDVALEVVERLAPLAHQSEITLQVGALPEAPIWGDRGLLGQALSNLIENAIKYTVGVGSHVTLTTEIAERDGREWAVARVCDNGPGIAHEHLPHLFERFYRVDSARARSSLDEAQPAKDGAGLGLAIVNRVAQAHGGEFYVESSKGIGATFEVWLPLHSCSGQ